ncbi:MAG: Hpt domain-containing protein [Gammaproteobacteria bacterium]
MLNRVIDNKIEADSHVLKALDEAVAVLPQLIEQLQGNRDPISSVSQLMATAHALAEGRPPPALTQVSSKKKLKQTSSEAAAEQLCSDQEAVAETSPDPVEESFTLTEHAGEADITLPTAGSDLSQITSDEATSLGVAEWPLEDDSNNLTDFDEIKADEISLQESADEKGPAEDTTRIDDESAAETVDPEEINRDDKSSLESSVTDVEFDFEIDEQQEVQQLESELAAGMDPVLFKIYYDESIGHLAVIHKLLVAHHENTQPLTASKELIRAFHTLYGSARTAEIDPIAELCGATEKYIKIKQEAPSLLIDDAIAELFEEVVQKVQSMLEQIKSGTVPDHNKALLDKISKAVQQELQRQLQQNYPDPDPESEPEIEAAPQLRDTDFDEPVEDHTSNRLTEEGSTELLEKQHEQVAQESSVYVQAESLAAISYSEIDTDLIDIFIEEADELIENCEELLQRLNNNPDDADSIHQLQRYMHTLKGGARMAELTPVGDLTHLLESLVIKVADKQVNTDRVLFTVLNDSVDCLAAMLKNVKDRAPIRIASDITTQIDALVTGKVPEKRNIERYDLELDDLSIAETEEQPLAEDAPASAIDVADVASQSQTTPGPNLGRRVTDKLERPQWGERATDANYRDTQEQIRIRADLLNELVNSAGEVNIYHARMGKQMSDIGFNINELESTVVRLKQQLRNLEIETEIQIRSSFEKESDLYGDDFDPLEMDKYSTIQQLSRSLTETASDVESIREILSEIVRDTETLLLQESRVSTELQEGLMRTRMVRFGGLSTRLRRILRQTSRELGKEVELEIIGDSNELDRTILDRIVAPLEHMLRNAVAHGIEAPDKRLAAGKPEIGRITIEVDRQGGDIVIFIKDDGAGINAAAIRTKAIQQGLLDTDSKVSDREVLQFILKSGFSTAERVSQVAGRGVGMDVVDAELKQLGGVLEIDTFPGKGTDFTIRLPLTLAINQALLVSAGEDVYAIPLASIEGVVRITGAELQKFYDSDQQMYSFNHVEYELKHLGQLLTGVRSDYSEQYGLYPVLLAQVGNKHYALHVDDLVGRREVVVKPVGHQLGAVRGIAGATILADGRVVLIIEMSALVVTENLLKEKEHADVEVKQPVDEKAEERTIMVVDDSITIRKVTARMLERNGINVLLAKDGIDATNLLIDTKPDLMLLDIEMPRMDGFELATYIRNDERLKDLPIIMITSRTGEKHKEKAMEIGVNQYLGKPYQEEELLKNINNILQT